MGKKQGEAARVKGNAKPSSSAKAAEMLQQVANYNFGSELQPIGIGTLMEDSFDTNVDPDFRMTFKKLNKKDTMTKIKSLEEFKNLIETKSQEDCVAIISYWSKSYTKLTIDNDRKIRELCQQVHEKLCSKVNKNIAPHLKTIMPYWLLAQSDNHFVASRIAENSFKSTFNETKQPEVVYFSRDEIIEVLNDFLLVQTAKTLSDMKNTSEDEAKQKYENIISMSLRGLGLFLKFFLSHESKFFKEASSAESIEKLEKIFNDPKFWKYSKETNLKIRSDFFQLLNQLIDIVLLNSNFIEFEKKNENFKFRKLLKTKLIPLIFYACDEDNQACSFFVWSSIIKCINNFELLNESGENFWSLLNVKKAFIPKLIALLRSHANGNANSQNIEIVFPSLSPLLKKLSSIFNDNNEEKFSFYKDFSCKIYDCSCVSKEANVFKARFGYDSNKVKIINALFDNYSFIYEDLIGSLNLNDNDLVVKNIDFCYENLLNHVLKLYDLYLDGVLSVQTTDGFGFEYKFQNFVDDTINNEAFKSNDKISSIKERFWNELSSIMLKKFEPNNQDNNDISKEVELTEKYLIILKNFCYLFRPLWNKEGSKSKDKIDYLVESLSKFFQDKFLDNVKNNSNETNRLTSLYLCGLNEITSNFIDEKMIDLLLVKIDNFSGSLSLHEKLKVINEKLIENSLKLSFDKNIQILEDNVLVGIIELYLLVNIKFAKPSEINNCLDYFLFEINKETYQSQLELFLRNYLNKCKSNKVDSIMRKSLNEWIIESDKLQEFILFKYLAKEKFYSNTAFAFDLIETLIKHESSKKEATIEKFFNSFLQTNMEYLKSIDSNSKTINYQEINKFLEFNSNLLFDLSQKISNKLFNLDLVWSILLSYLTLRSNLIAKNETLEHNLKDSIKKMVNLLFKNQSNEQDFGQFNPLIDFINAGLKDEKTNLNEIIDELVQEIEILKGKEFINEFYKSVLLKINFNFKNIFNSFLFPNESVNCDLMVKFYLDKRLSYLYTDFFSSIINQQNMNPEWLNIENMNKIKYSLTQINAYIRSQTKLTPELFLDPTNILSDWYYLFLSAIIVDKFYIGSIQVQNIKTEFKKLINEGDLLKVLFELLSSSEKAMNTFIECVFAPDQLKLELNNVSLLLTYLVDLGVKDVATFSQNLMAFLISELNDFEELIKIYIYDIPFAKQSILDNLGNLIENMDHYYGLFSGIIESSIQKLEYLINELNLMNKSDSSENYLSSLKNFNFVLDLLIKYIAFYFELVNTTVSNENSIENIVYKLFNSNEKTSKFLTEKLSIYLLKIVDMFIDLKTSISQNLNTLMKTLSLTRFGVGNFFYFDFDFTDKSDSSLKWEQFLLIDKLNQFLSLFFINYKLDLEGFRYSQQMSQFLKDKHWDFILCYSSAISQRLKAPISNHLNDKVYLQLFLISFCDLLNSLIKCVKFRVRDNRPGTYPKQVYSDWNGFFTKEIFYPLLNSFTKLSNFYSNKPLSYSAQFSISKLGNVVSQIPFECLLFNDLEANFNVLDMDLNKEKIKSINLNDQLKTVLNYLIPNLKHQISSIQFNSYKILRSIMVKISDYYGTENDEQEVEINIIQSLPHVVKEIFFELADLFADLKNTVPFDQNILMINEQDLFEKNEKNLEFKQLVHETNNKIMAYLFINKLILDMFSTNNLEFKVKLVNNLRELNFSDHILHCLFRLMPNFKNASMKLFQSLINDSDYDSEDLDETLNQLNIITFKNEFVEEYSCKLFKYALKSVPAMIRDWFNMQQKRIADQVDKFTTKYVSPILIEEEIKQINRSANSLNTGSDLDDDQSSIKIKGMLSTREIVSTYKMKELSMELVIQLPINYPLGVVDVSSIKRLGVSENEWRNWLLQLTTYLTHQNGSIIQGLQIWKRNVDKKFSGVEECTICYSVIHGTNYQLPKMKCRTCKHMFHSVCLYKWFESSTKSTCPLCRNLF